MVFHGFRHGFLAVFVSPSYSLAAENPTASHGFPRPEPDKASSPATGSTEARLVLVVQE